MFRVVENWVLFYLTMTYIGKCNIILNTDSGTATKFWLGGGRILVRQTHLPQIPISPQILATLFWKSWKI